MRVRSLLRAVLVPLIYSQACDRDGDALAKARSKTESLKKADRKFELVEASIADLHTAIGLGQVTCEQIVKRYIERAKAYNGTCTKLVTVDGADIPSATGQLRAWASRTPGRSSARDDQHPRRAFGVVQAAGRISGSAINSGSSVAAWKMP